MTVTELMYYGRYYRNENEPNYIWWFDLQSKQLCQYEDLLEKFGYHSQEDLMNTGKFVPLFKTDILALEYRFILETKSKKVINFFDKLSDSDFDREFKIFIEKNFMVEAWHHFEKRHLYEDALQWCEQHCILGIKAD